jgi:hypothetical protein
MSLDDYKNGFKYNVLSLNTNDGEHAAVDEKFTYVRAAYCAMMCKMSLEITYKYLELAVNCSDPPIDGFIYYLKVSIDNKCVQRAVPYIKKAFDLVKPIGESTLVNHNFYDYVRWNLISIVCLLSNTNLEIGYDACQRAIKARNMPDDLHNIQIYEQLKRENKFTINSSSNNVIITDITESHKDFETRIKDMIKMLNQVDIIKLKNEHLLEIKWLLQETMKKLNI